MKTQGKDARNQTGWFAWAEGYSLGQIRSGVDAVVHDTQGDCSDLSHLRADIWAGLLLLRDTDKRACQAVVMDASGYEPERIASAVGLTASESNGHKLVMQSWTKLWELVNGHRRVPATSPADGREV